MEKIEINSENEYEIQLPTDKNNTYSITFISDDSLEITANLINSIINKSFSNRFAFEEIKENEYFLEFNDLNEIFDEIKDKIINNKITINENENSLEIKIALSSEENKEITFELKYIFKTNKEAINDLNKIIVEQNNEIIDLKNKINDLDEKLKRLWEEKKKKKKISNLNSVILNGNDKYNESLKYWIDPSKKIKAQLLYRLSENGNSFLTFHQLCDNKGPNLSLFHINNGDIVGIYTPLDFDTSEKWKEDTETFLFNLSKNKKFKKWVKEKSIYCGASYGPNTRAFGITLGYPMNKLYFNIRGMDSYYCKGGDILPCSNVTNIFDLIEVEIYQIIIE